MSDRITHLIREYVPRPEPEDLIPICPRRSQRNLRFGKLFIRETCPWILEYGNVCPMGRLPGALNAAPYISHVLPGYELSSEQIQAWANWWDKFDDPAEAIRAVWGDDDGPKPTGRPFFKPCWSCPWISECRNKLRCQADEWPSTTLRDGRGREGSRSV